MATKTKISKIGNVNTKVKKVGNNFILALSYKTGRGLVNTAVKRFSKEPNKDQIKDFIKRSNVTKDTAINLTPILGKIEEAVTKLK